MSIVQVCGTVFIVLAAATGILQFGFRRIYNYALTPTRFEVRLFGRLPIYHIGFCDLAGVAPWRLTLASVGSAFVTLSLGNRVVGRAIVLERSVGFPRYVVVTPDDADRMLVELAARIRR